MALEVIVETERFYDSLARSHRLFYQDWPGAVRREGEWLGALLAPTGARRVLDCTAGIGTQALGLALHGFEVMATDLSLANLAEARAASVDLGVSVSFGQADILRLDEAALDGPFDAIVTLGNSLPHLLSDDDMARALVSLHGLLAPGGTLLVGQRDWDAIDRDRPRFVFRHDHRDTPGPGQRTVVFDLWHYAEAPIVTFEVFFLEQGPDGWRTESFSLRYRMWPLSALEGHLRRAGFEDVRRVDCKWEVRVTARRPR
jgi:glycine/sarcosine N-methyltransferase